MRTLAALAALALTACAATRQSGGLRLAQSNLQDGDIQTALEYLEDVIALGPVDPMKQLEAYYLKARVLEGLERKQEAAGLYRYIATSSPKSDLGILAAARRHDIDQACKAPSE